MEISNPPVDSSLATFLFPSPPPLPHQKSIPPPPPAKFLITHWVEFTPTPTPYRYLENSGMCHALLVASAKILARKRCNYSWP